MLGFLIGFIVAFVLYIGIYYLVRFIKKKKNPGKKVDDINDYYK